MVASARTLQASESPISIGWFQKNEKSIPTVKICFFGIFLGMAIYIYIDRHRVEIEPFAMVARNRWFIDDLPMFKANHQITI